MNAKPRSLVATLDAVLAVVPPVARITRLEVGRIREEASYAPPEAMRLLWRRAEVTLIALIGQPKHRWHQEVYAIMAGEREVAETAPNPEVTIYRVRYYDRQRSRKGQGVQTATFRDPDEAERFASQNILYARRCKVEPVGLQRTKGAT